MKNLFQKEEIATHCFGITEHQPDLKPLTGEELRLFYNGKRHNRIGEPTGAEIREIKQLFLEFLKKIPVEAQNMRFILALFTLLSSLLTLSERGGEKSAVFQHMNETLREFSTSSRRDQPTQ
ncbi:hypothetical protein KBC79_04780 [Candidatus Woesebacteria bacterium]|nr:hypothetical protein [Candidatus Woesebacteria bacterium]